MGKPGYLETILNKSSSLVSLIIFLCPIIPYFLLGGCEP